jgi:hypothetical protein
LRATSHCIAFARFPKLPIIPAMRNAIASAIWDQNSALRTDRGRLGRHGVDLAIRRKMQCRTESSKN